MAEIASLVVNVAGNITGAVNSFKSLEQTSRSTAKKIESNFSSLKNIGVGLFSSAILKNIVDTGIQFQSIRQSLQAVTGSAQGMNDAMKFIDQTAQRTGVNILNASKDFRLLLGSAQGAGYAMQDIKNTFSGVADASLVLGMRVDDVTGLMRAFGQIMSKGTVQAEELKGQIGDRLPGALGLASKAMGVTNAQLLKMMETGTLMSKDFLPKFSEQLKKTYGDLVPLFQGTALKAFNDFDNAMLKLKDSIATSGLLDFVTQLIKSTTDMVNGLSGSSEGVSELRELFSTLSSALQLSVDAFRNIKDVMKEFNITITDLIVLFISYKVSLSAIDVATKLFTVSTIGLSSATKAMALDLALMGVSINNSIRLATMATTAFNLLKVTLSRIVFPLGIAWAFYEVITKLGEASGVTARAFEDMVSRFGVLELNTQIGKTKEQIELLKQEVGNLYGINYDKLTPKEIGNSKFLQNITKDVREAEKKLETLEKRRIELAKAQTADIEQKNLEKEQNIALKRQDVFEKTEALRLASLSENQRKLETVLRERRRLLQDIYESSLDEKGNVVIDYSKLKQVEGKPIWTADKIAEAISYFDKREAKVREEILKEALADVSKFQKELQSIYDMKEGLKGGTEFSKEWGNFLSKFSKERIAEITGSGEINKLKEELQDVFNAKKVKEFSDELDNLKVEDFTRNLSEADKYAYSLNATFEKLGTTGNEALEKKNELIKQFNENQKNLQKDNYLANYGTVEERTAQRRLELERQFGKLKESEPELFKKIQAESEKQIALDETLYKEKLKGVNTWGEAYQAWLDKTQASQQSWGEQIVSVFDTMSNAMTSAMTDFLDITSDGFADFGKMATSILQEVYREILKVMVVKPLVSSITSAFMPTAWNGGIANGSGFQRFASGYIAGGGYSSVDSLSNDKIPALISKGESVIPASVTNANRGLISAMIASRGSGRKFANGYIASGDGSGTTKVEIINQSGQKMEVTSASQTFDTEGAVLSIVINAINTNKMGLRTMVSRA